MSLFRQIMLIVTAGVENYQKNMLNPKKDGASTQQIFSTVTYLQ